jgi:hypothetical protein
MSEFAPPKGQKCGNCICCEPDPAMLPVAESTCRSRMIDLCGTQDDPGCTPPAVMLSSWCGHWRGSAEVRCGGCKWYKQTECPRFRVVDGNATFKGKGTRGPVYASHHSGIECPMPQAFACERWEEKG